MISAGVEGRLPYMTYSEPWSRNPPKQPSEVFLRPAPKLLPPPPTNRTFNGVPVSSYPNGTRIVPSRPISKYPSPPPSAIPVNLTQPKEEIKEDPLSPYSRYLFHSTQYAPFGYPTLCQPSYILRTPTFPPTPLSPQEIFSPATPTASSTGTFLSPPTTYSPPSTVVKPPQTILRRSSPVVSSPHVPNSPLPQSPSFKVPSGKEGSLKHRLLVRPEDAINRSAPLDLQKPPEGRGRLTAATISPPRSPKRHLNNNTVPANFQKGQLIQLANGEFKKIEEMRTEDFIQSAEKCPSLKLAESTVVKIEEGKEGHVMVTLTYDQRRAQVEIDSTLEHPYFVMGHGWASCNPDRTLQVYGLKVHRLQVGDVMVSVTPREPQPSSNTSRSTTIMTTATTTAMSSRQYSRIASTSTVTSTSSNHIPSTSLPLTNHFTSQPNPTPPSHTPPQNHRPLSHSPPKTLKSPEYMVPPSTMSYYASAQMTPLQLDAESRKRRWSAPDAIEEEELARRSRIE
ncbi:uncharacterized protein LOC126740010 [Anthonomus grandis grandis]|uniref:uncharacterized protein LOC126740010 n=1 Tax=Anthonomus grandis grandis TaxID=2921223 RepID=UPI002165A89B|nr:uncharacterized protein LOC126740010 [Anthonomus grandis grandis]XP_050301820.1 uncharacterized protein LOC126740010 [Anthonomus grandis grandis]XP_050301821.1 uncharacterized protein LOC126740010 [Anthonomus grandis grandis]XP_050301822.1 uncharacterized protein LOC126740010 [Anthonomus grandis grandis]